jgi:hypothetical protein
LQLKVLFCQFVAPPTCAPREPARERRPDALGEAHCDSREQRFDLRQDGKTSSGPGL